MTIIWSLSSNFDSGLKEEKQLWKNYAIKIAPEAAKQLFWKSYQCEKSGGSLICTDFEGHSMTTSWSSVWNIGLFSLKT